MSYLPIFLLLAVVVIVLIWGHRGHKGQVATFNEPYAKFNERFPPIDDEEFVRRCRPGVNRDTALRVRRIISEQLGIEYERIYPEQSLVNDLGCD